jgi:hypothetical protein
VVAPDYRLAEVEVARALLGAKPGSHIKALDIGAGIGKGMLALGKAGLDVWGIEPSPSFRKLAVERLGIDPARIVEASVEEATFARHRRRPRLASTGRHSSRGGAVL